jgi:hypothetical protein
MTAMAAWFLSTRLPLQLPLIGIKFTNYTQWPYHVYNVDTQLVSAAEDVEGVL